MSSGHVDHRRLLVPPGHAVRLSDYDPAFTCGYSSSEEAREKLESDIVRLKELQDVFYAARTYGLLVIFQAMDAAGKDGAIKHVTSGLNPQGVHVTSFQAPSVAELAHDYLWRHARALPERGQIAIFNRSHYEEVLAVRVHPELLAHQNLPSATQHDGFWRDRFGDINAFERHLVRNSVFVVKFFLHISKEEQRQRLMARIDTPDKNWKFSMADLQEREAWDAYMQAYESALSHTSTEWAPWYVVPADHKWLARVVVADVLVARLSALGLRYPIVDDRQREVLSQARALLEQQAERSNSALESES